MRPLCLSIDLQLHIAGLNYGCFERLLISVRKIRGSGVKSTDGKVWGTQAVLENLNLNLKLDYSG